MLYNYNENNLNSICGSLKNKNLYEILEGNLFLNILKCKNKIELNKIIKKYDHDTQKKMKYIYDFCELKLYIV